MTNIQLYTTKRIRGSATIH